MYYYIKKFESLISGSQIPILRISHVTEMLLFLSPWSPLEFMLMR